MDGMNAVSFRLVALANFLSAFAEAFMALLASCRAELAMLSFFLALLTGTAILSALHAAGLIFAAAFGSPSLMALGLAPIAIVPALASAFGWASRLTTRLFDLAIIGSASGFVAMAQLASAAMAIEDALYLLAKLASGSVAKFLSIAPR